MQAKDAMHARPWLGLASFTEANAAQFFGREAEVAELVRRLSRKGLTVLFGQSGLGKTSMLQAGVVPRLREAGFAPVLLRMDYSAESPSCEAQMLAALGWGTSEGLWEQLHQRDREGPAPLLIFDQFEEVFTLGQADEAGRAKAAAFLGQLADLVENRVPTSLEAKLDQDDSLFDRYDLQRADFRLLISLREDYLAHLEPLKAAMPGITQNRMRIAPMTGEQALQAVCGPGGELVSTDTAEAIVCFVSGAKTIQHAEVEPALLSLILRELNEQRIAKGQAQITPDLLAGSHAAILSDFYERSLADQPTGVRHFIEDQLLTDTGYRENVAEERVQQTFAAAGAQPGALAVLVNRRLLRVEERLDRRRVELTHDTLCAVVAASRDNRREREQLAAAEAQALQQRELADAARATARRSRRVALVSGSLGALALAAGGLAFVQSRQAKRAETLADGARAQAQELLNYLLDDFYDELEPIGRLTLLRKLSERAVKYYEDLPAELRNRDTELSHAQAVTKLGELLIAQGEFDKGWPRVEEALKRVEGGDGKPDWQLAQARAWLLRSSAAVSGGVAYAGGDEVALQWATRALDLLRPLGESPLADRRTQVLLLQALLRRGTQFQRGERPEEARQDLSQAVAVASRLDPELRDEGAILRARLQATAWWTVSLVSLEQQGEAIEVAGQGIAVADNVLKVSTGQPIALAARGRLHLERAFAQFATNDAEAALRSSERGLQDVKVVLQIDPTQTGAWNSKGNVLRQMAQLHVDRGDWALAWTAFAEAHEAFRLTRSSLGRGNGASTLWRQAQLSGQRGRMADLMDCLDQLDRHHLTSSQVSDVFRARARFIGSVLTQGAEAPELRPRPKEWFKFQTEQSNFNLGGILMVADELSMALLSTKRHQEVLELMPLMGLDARSAGNPAPLPGWATVARAVVGRPAGRLQADLIRYRALAHFALGNAADAQADARLATDRLQSTFYGRPPSARARLELAQDAITRALVAEAPARAAAWREAKAAFAAVPPAFADLRLTAFWRQLLRDQGRSLKP